MDKKFYLGRIFDPATIQNTDQPLLYEPDDLTTHAVVVGMTGSGKTGLCIDLLEEAALQGIPALMIDPKGDITNLLLHFPALLPQDFQPWVDPDVSRRLGQSQEQAAADAAARWREGLAAWDVPLERLQALQNAVHFAVYTPGSDAGIPVSILASLKAPPIPWEQNRELLREKITGTVTALLGLVGLDHIDPVRSREHILLANIFEHAWSQNRDLDLSELILQAQNPPLDRLGVFDINTFFPEKDRFELAMLLNNILAAPAFHTWIEGQPLDISALLYHPDGRPRHSVFYIAHLSDAERMFFVTLLYSALEAWMRAQTGTPALRLLLYFDEIFGFLPPLGNPPSKQPMLRLLKQARAFGVGQVLVTQNPVDVDYKALSNAGTWFIGKLQTDQDKQRLLDGLQGASGGTLDRGEYDRLISSLGQRIFLLHNVHNPHPLLFQTRWAMNYLAGPLTRAQIPDLNRLAGAVSYADQPASLPDIGPPAGAQPASAEPVIGVPLQPAAAPAVDDTQPVPVRASAVPAPPAPLTVQEQIGSVTRPAVLGGVTEYFLPNNLTLSQAFQVTGRTYPPQARSQGLVYRPELLAQCVVRYANRKYRLDTSLKQAARVALLDRHGVMRWEDYQAAPVEASQLESQPAPEARFAALPSAFSEAKLLRSLQTDFQNWVYRTSQVSVRANQPLDIFAGPEVSPAEFRRICAEAARQQRDQEVRKSADNYDRRITALKERLAHEQRELSQDETELSQRRMEELGTHAENFLSLFSRRRSRRLSTSLTRRRLTEQAKADVDESLDAIDDYKDQIDALDQEKAQAVKEINDRWARAANQVEEIPVTPYKKDVIIDLFGVAWVPYHSVRVGDETIELSGFTSH
jgi:Helicase HerA, central domain